MSEATAARKERPGDRICMAESKQSVTFFFAGMLNVKKCFSYGGEKVLTSSLKLVCLFERDRRKLPCQKSLDFTGELSCKNGLKLLMSAKYQDAIHTTR